MPARKPVQPADLRDGTITEVRAQKRDPERVAVFIDGAFVFGLQAEIAIRAGLRKGLAVTAAEQAGWLAEEQGARARRSALDLVAHRPRTESEVRRRLERRGFDPVTATDTVSWLRRLGYVDDAAYARQFAQERLRRRGHGPTRVRIDLMRRGVDAHLVDLAIADHADEDALREAAHRLAVDRWARLSQEQDLRKRRRKLYDYLARRGYDFDLIREVGDAVEREAPSGDAENR